MTGPDLIPISVRIDKWLWSVRICKTRLIATELCKRHKVILDGQPVKPSRNVNVGQEIIVRKEGISWHYRVLNCIDKRVGASVAKECCEDITPQEERNKLALIKGGWVPRRAKGEGRPTKKERRDMERVVGV
ncbi:MAG: RNA-binding S4 domain-containing protein [Candidatus Omnitrophica bacterium]|nr:RNA-binding S4 domain-containing protein [Candidatus Omnitrophota bacterium]